MAHKNSKISMLNVNFIYLIAAIFSVAFLLFSIVFMFYSEQDSKSQAHEYMEESTRQSCVIVETQLENDISTLNALAKLYDRLDIELTTNSLTMLKDAASLNNFDRIGIADTEGNCAWINSMGYVSTWSELEQYPAYTATMDGNAVISSIGKDKTTGKDMLFYFVPIKSSGKVEGAVLASVPLERLMDIISSSVFGQRGYAQIIDKSGNIIVPSNSTLQPANSENVLETTPDWQKEQILADLAAGREGSTNRNFSGANTWGAYSPLNINGWYLFYAVPDADIIINYDLVSNGMTIIITAAAIMFLFFIMIIRFVNRKSISTLEEYAFIDTLTGQRTFQKFLLDSGKLISNTKVKYSLWYCDIKNFKNVNDIMGYTIGDNVLKYWAMVLNQDLQKGEAFGRVNADNFICLLEYTDVLELKTRFDLYATMLENFEETAAQGLKIEMSAGIFLIENEDADLSLNDMLDRANVAQKSIKRLSGSRCAIYSSEMRDRILKETEMEIRMESALLNGEFRVYLQPRISISTGSHVAGAEALVRWQWPEKGLIPPDDFIPLFEKNGFIVRLDEFMLEQVCQMFFWHINKLKHIPFSVSVNVSRAGIMQPNFIERYVAIKNRYSIPDGFIELEFTESIAFNNHEVFRTIVNELQSKGFSCALDDFGSGHSSLNILKELPVDVLKIDRLFFNKGQDSNRDKEVIKSIISMAQALNMTTVAEGIESKEQVDMLRQMGCDIVQGFVFARPMPEDEFLLFIKRMDGIEL